MPGYRKGEDESFFWGFYGNLGYRTTVRANCGLMRLTTQNVIPEWDPAPGTGIASHLKSGTQPLHRNIYTTSLIYLSLSLFLDIDIGT
jgi:hypothetical protein